MGFEVIVADHHRNGVGGMPFSVAIVNDDEHGRMLVIDFDEPGKFEGYTAVINLDKAVEGNIYMFQQIDEGGAYIDGTGGNAWRGDVLGEMYRAAIDKVVEVNRDEQLARSTAKYKERLTRI